MSSNINDIKLNNKTDNSTLLSQAYKTNGFRFWRIF